MPVTFTHVADMLAHGRDCLIDARSPAEFVEDHIPGAINLPALTDDQRHEVGSAYKQINPFTARKMGATYVARNVADHVEQRLSQHDGSWQPLVYCWRGGQRSGSFTLILQQIGWRADTIEGGYKTWRRLVNKALYDEPLQHRFVLLDGNTGTAKTAILNKVKAAGGQVIDLEGLANHRGSLLGARPEGQPDQKWFETQLIEQIEGYDPARPILVEAESSKIGRINLPPSLWTAMLSAPCIEISADLATRAAYLEHDYADMVDDPAELRKRIAPLHQQRGHETVARWMAHLSAKNYGALAADLMKDHYDPAYAKARAAYPRDVVATVRADTLDDAGQELAAQQVLAELKRL